VGRMATVGGRKIKLVHYMEIFGALYPCYFVPLWIRSLAY